MEKTSNGRKLTVSKLRTLLRMKDLTSYGINNWPSLKRRVLNDNFPAGVYVGKSRCWDLEDCERWWKGRPSAAPPDIVKPGPSVDAEGTGPKAAQAGNQSNSSDSSAPAPVQALPSGRG
jgi:hypothetical protein